MNKAGSRYSAVRRSSKWVRKEQAKLRNPLKLILCVYRSQRLSTDMLGGAPGSDPSLPRIPTRIASARRAQRDGWILSINNRQSEAKTTMFFSPCFVSGPGQKEAAVRTCWIQHTGPQIFGMHLDEGKIEARNLKNRGEGDREIGKTCLHMNLETQDGVTACWSGMVLII